MRIPRTITRTTIMYNVRSQPEIENTLREIAGKGYHEVALYAILDDQDESFLPKGAEGGYTLDELRPICSEIVRQGLSVLIFTQYQKRNTNYLLDHPEQTTRLLKLPSHIKGGGISLETGEARPAVTDEDFVNWDGRACIFHPNFKARYIRFLKSIAQLPGLALIQVNDESRLGASGYAIACYCDECGRTYRKAFDREMPTTFDWSSPEWRGFIGWRFEQWNLLHAELRDAIREVNPQVAVGFQCTPMADGWRTPAWVSGVDVDGMMEYLDDLSFDAYHAAYTDFPDQFRPPAASLGEIARFCVAAAKDKSTTMIVQGFNPAMYLSETLERDGWWMGVIPHAVGIRRTFTFFYETHKANPSITTFEASFRLDEELGNHRPVDYIAVVHSNASENYVDALPDVGPQSYHERWLYAASEPLRHCGVPFSYLMDRQVTPGGLKPYRAVVVPQVSAISDDGLTALEAFVQAGGGLVAFGDLGATDSIGEPRIDSGSFLDRIFGVRPGEKVKDPTIGVVIDHEIARDLRRGYPDIEHGVTRLALRDAREIEITADDTAVLASYAGENGGPAVTLRNVGRGRCVYFAGPPSKRAKAPWIGNYPFADSPSFAPNLLANAIEWAAGGPPAARIEGLPAVTGYVKCRPYDGRIVPTHEFFPMVGENSYLLVVASYWAEAADVRLMIRLPAGVSKEGCEVRELVRSKNADFEVRDGELVIQVHIAMEYPLLIYRVQFPVRLE